MVPYDVLPDSYSKDMAAGATSQIGMEDSFEALFCNESLDQLIWGLSEILPDALVTFRYKIMALLLGQT